MTTIHYTVRFSFLLVFGVTTVLSQDGTPELHENMYHYDDVVPHYDNVNDDYTNYIYNDYDNISTTIDDEDALRASRKQKFKSVFSWKVLDFKYPSAADRQKDIDNGVFVPENVFPLGIAVSGSRIFISTPRFLTGLPATLSYFKYTTKQKSPKLIPYPSWAKNRVDPSCNSITSVFRVHIDSCKRMWVLDTGSILIPKNQLCPPQIIVFDLRNDLIIDRFNIPFNTIGNNSVVVTLEVEYPNQACGRLKDAYVYVSDPEEFRMIVIQMRTKKAWLVDNDTTQPNTETDPVVVEDTQNFYNDGIGALGLGPLYQGKHRMLYYHSMSSYKQHYVQTRYLKNKQIAQNKRSVFKTVPVERKSQACPSVGMDRNGVLFYSLIPRHGIGCWHTYRRITKKTSKNFVTLEINPKMKFITTIMVDSQSRFWAIDSSIHRLMNLSTSITNFRVFYAPNTHDLVKGTRCQHFH